MDMVDGNSAALDQYTAAQDKTERVWAAREKEVVEEIVDDMMFGRKVSHWRLADLLDGEDFAELLARLVMADSDTRNAIVDELRECAEALVRKWVETDSGQAILADRVWEAEKDAQEAA